MGVLTYKVPISSIAIPVDRVGPPAYNGPRIVYVTGTNKDWYAARMEETDDEDFFIEVPVPESYTGGGVALRMRITSEVIVGNFKIDVRNEESGGSGEVWDETFSNGPDTATVAVPGTLGETEILTIAALSGAGALTAGKVLRLYVTRDNAVGSNAAGHVDIVDIDVLFTIPAGITLSGVVDEEFAAGSMSYAAPVSEYTVGSSALADAAWYGLYNLYFDGLRADPGGVPTKRVAGVPAAAGEWRINGTTLQVYGDQTASGSTLSVTYPV